MDHYFCSSKLMIFIALFAVSLSYLLCKLVFRWWISPAIVYSKIKRNGFGGPSPRFPLGNINEMRKRNFVGTKSNSDHQLGFPVVSHDIHSTVFPYFSTWQKSHGMYEN